MLKVMPMVATAMGQGDEVQVRRKDLRRGEVLEVRVHPDDLGRVSDALQRAMLRDAPQLTILATSREPLGPYPKKLTERLLHEVSDTRARLVILDIAGVVVIAPIGLTIWLIWTFAGWVDSVVMPSGCRADRRAEERGHPVDGESTACERRE